MMNQQTNLQITTHTINLISLCFIEYIVVFAMYFRLKIFGHELTQSIEAIVIFILIGALNALPNLLLWHTNKRLSNTTDRINCLIIGLGIFASNIFFYHQTLLTNDIQFLAHDIKFIGLLLILTPLPAIIITLCYHFYIRHNINKSSPNNIN